MSATRRRWAVRLTSAAEVDFENILRWTAGQFGAHQARTYARTLTLAIEALHQGPDVLGATFRDDVAPGVRVLHVARSGRKGRHFIVFRVQEAGDSAAIEVLRILHDAMDLPRHLEP